MLDLMFKNGSRWSGTFQLVSTLSRCPRQIEKLYLEKAISFLWCFFPRLKVATDIDRNKPARIMERSIFSERYCFLENQRRNGILSAAEFALMDRWFQWALNQLGDNVKPDLIGITQCLKIARKVSFDIIASEASFFLVFVGIVLFYERTLLRNNKLK